MTAGGYRASCAQICAHMAVLPGPEARENVGKTERRARDSNPEGVSPGGFQDRCLTN